MKTLLSISLVAVALCGCKSPGSLGGLLAARETIVTNQVPTPVVTHQAEIVRDAVGIVETNFVTVTNIESRTYFVTNTVWEVAPAVRGSLDTVGTFAPLAGPYAPAVAFGTSIASLFLGAAVRRKNAQNESLAGQLTAVVQGVEKAAEVLPEGSKVKATIADVAAKLDVATDLHKTVKNLT